MDSKNKKTDDGFTDLAGLEDPSSHGNVENLPVWKQKYYRKYAVKGQPIPDTTLFSNSKLYRKWIIIFLMVTIIFGTFIGMMVTFYRPHRHKHGGSDHTTVDVADSPTVLQTTTLQNIINSTITDGLNLTYTTPSV